MEAKICIADGIEGSGNGDGTGIAESPDAMEKLLLLHKSRLALLDTMIDQIDHSMQQANKERAKTLGMISALEIKVASKGGQ